MGKQEIEEEIKREFLTKAHFEALSDLIVHRENSSNQGKLNIIVSFRQAGASAIRMLEAGAGAKPHAILHKSVKQERLRENFTEEAIQGVPNIDRIFGLVARPTDRTGNLNIDGLYLTSEGVRHFTGNADERYEVVGDGKTNYLKVKGGLVEFIDSFTKTGTQVQPADKYAKWFISGDYDIHDLIYLSGSSRHPVPSGSSEEAEFLIRMNDAMKGTNRWREGNREFMPDEYDPVQHGPQYNYIVYTYSNEPDEKINEKVAQIDCPVAVCDQEGWKIIRRPADLVKYYDDKFIKVKELWRLSDEGERYLRQCANKSFHEYMDEVTGKVPARK